MLKRKLPESTSVPKIISPTVKRPKNSATNATTTALMHDENEDRRRTRADNWMQPLLYIAAFAISKHPSCTCVRTVTARVVCRV